MEFAEQIIITLTISCFGIHILYCLFFLYAHHFKRVKPTENILNSSVSIVVCAHNEEKNLLVLLPILIEQAYSDYEIIIVLDRCSDRSIEIVSEYENKHAHIKKIVIDETPTDINPKKHALTQGIAKAKNEWILLTDADCIPASVYWVLSMMRCVEKDTKFVLGISPYLKKEGVLNQFIQYETFITALQYSSFTLLGYPYMGVGRNMMYKKEVFEHNEGFKGYAHRTGGDDDLFVNTHANKMNTRLCLHKEALVYSEPKTKLKAYIVQKTRHMAAGKAYNLQSKLMTGLFYFVYTASAPLFLISMLLFGFSLLLLVLFVLRTIVLFITFEDVSNKLNIKSEIRTFAVGDALFSIYLFYIGLKAFLSKRVRWI